MRTTAAWRLAKKGLAAAITASALVLMVPGPTGAAVGTDDFPYRGRVGLLDPWGFYTGYCTSFAAWRLSQAGLRLRGATLTGPNGSSHFFGNGGTWDNAAAAIGYRVDATPAPGAVAVWHGGEDGAWSGGHVAYVMGVDGAGRALVEEYNWRVRFGYGVRTTRAPRYIHFIGAAAPAPAPRPAPTPTLTPTPAPPPQPAFREYRVTATVRQRTGPGTGFGVAGMVPDGSAIRVTCQTRSASVINGSGIWDRLVDGTYVTDYYTTTPAFNDFSPGLARC